MLSSTALADKLRGRRGTSLALLLALVSGYGVIVYFGYDEQQFMDPISRSLQEQEAAGVELDLGDLEDPSGASERILAKNGDSPPTMDEVPGEYIVKPWVGYANDDVWETKAQTKLLLQSAQASSARATEFNPRQAIDDPNLETRWQSILSMDGGSEWVTVDMGGPQTVAEVYIKWADAYAVDFNIEVAFERTNCRKDGRSCPDYWINFASITGKSDSEATTSIFDGAPQGIRYVRLQMTKRAPGFNNFSVYYISVYRKPMIIGENPNQLFCGDTVTAVTNSLLSNYGGTLIQTYENAEFFAASMTEAQKDAMFADGCTFTVEPNYVVKARGRTTKRRLRDPDMKEARANHEKGRKLAIPEFNLKDEEPPSWGLERISSHGKLNGKYTWFHEGADSHIYMFDTGIYPDHSEWDMRNGTSRLQEPLICAGTANDYLTADHGTHMASLAAGWRHGTGKSAFIHPIQVLDATGKGTSASFLCGVEKLLQDGKDYNTANAPKKIRAVVSLSLGVDGHSDVLDKAVMDMTMVGYTVVIAAGDHDGNACFYSPYGDSAITVGSLSNAENGANDKTTSSNFGECIDLWAPGEGISGASNQGEFETVMKDGTSVAAAFAAGAASLFFEEINTEEMAVEELAARVKEKVVNKAEIGILEEIGEGSPNKILQTTAVRCLQNSHCAVGLTCLRDGVCVDLSKPLKRHSTQY